MKKIINPTISIDADTLLNDFIWNAARYAIRRCTYMSGLHRDIWGVLKGNLDKFNHERLMFFARDIKAEVSDRCRWWINVDTEGAYNDRIRYDAYTLLGKYMCEHPDTDAKHTKFIVDCIKGTVATEPWEKPERWIGDAWDGLGDCDIDGWQTLAMKIDRLDAVQVTTEYEGKTETYPCIPVYTCVRYSADEPWRWELRYNPIDKPASTIIAEEYIRKVESSNKE